MKNINNSKTCNKKKRRKCLFKPSNFKVWFIDNQCFNFLLTVILDNSDFLLTVILDNSVFD